MSAGSSEEGSKGGGVGIADLSGDLLDALVGGVGEVGGAFDSESLNEVDWAHPENSLGASFQCASTGTEDGCDIVKVEWFVQVDADVLFKFQHEGVRVREVVQDEVTALGGSFVDHEHSSDVLSERWAYSSHDREGQVEVCECCSCGHLSVVGNHHGIEIECHGRVSSTKRGTEPPTCRCVVLVEQTGFGQREDARACGSNACGAMVDTAERSSHGSYIAAFQRFRRVVLVEGAERRDHDRVEAVKIGQAHRYRNGEPGTRDDLAACADNIDTDGRDRTVECGPEDLRCSQHVNEHGERRRETTIDSDERDVHDAYGTKSVVSATGR